ncbi:hypothetical protein K474DRAFT_1605719 [Panus rudis PR-1116 ss-1]|nr:hypothetical protein K474DRAFT_1605719 [Panus rudis PR-1116 ss-1]
MNRIDKRNTDQLREIVVIYEGLDRVDGSARFAFGDTESIVSVSGPVEVRPALENPSQATLDIYIRPLASLPGIDAKSIGTTLKAILTPALLLSQHPRTLVQLVGQALCGSETGSGTGSAGRGWNDTLISTLVNASSAAFVNASSVPMKGVIASVAIGRITNPETDVPTLVLDPSEAELPSLTASGCFAFLFSSTLSSVSKSRYDDVPPCSLLWTNYSSSDKSFDEGEFAAARALAERGVTEVWRKIKDSIVTMEKKSNSDGSRPPIKQEDSKMKSENDSDDDAKMEI